jgi:hypothetical protein
VSSLGQNESRRKLETSLRAGESYRRFEEAVSENLQALDEWRRFVRERIGPRIKSWLADVAVEPLE